MPVKSGLGGRELDAAHRRHVGQGHGQGRDGQAGLARNGGAGRRGGRCFRSFGVAEVRHQVRGQFGAMLGGALDGAGQRVERALKTAIRVWRHGGRRGLAGGRPGHGGAPRKVSPHTPSPACVKRNCEGGFKLRPRLDAMTRNMRVREAFSERSLHRCTQINTDFSTYYHQFPRQLTGKDRFAIEVSRRPHKQVKLLKNLCLSVCICGYPLLSQAWAAGFRRWGSPFRLS